MTSIEVLVASALLVIAVAAIVVLILALLATHIHRTDENMHYHYSRYVRATRLDVGADAYETIDGVSADFFTNHHESDLKKK